MMHDGPGINMDLQLPPHMRMVWPASRLMFRHFFENMASHAVVRASGMVDAAAGSRLFGRLNAIFSSATVYWA